MTLSKLLFLPLLIPTLCYGEMLDRLRNDSEETPIIIEAENSVVCDETMNKCVATGNALAKKGTSTIYADVLTVFFTEGKGRDITAMMADGHVVMETPSEKAYGDHAHYDVALDRVLLTGGNLKIVTSKENITARDSLEYWHAQNKGIARGKAVATFPEKEELIEADTLTAYFSPSEGKKKEGKEKLSIDRLEAEGNMLASSPKGFVTGDRGVYYAKNHLVEVFDNVRILQGDNIIEGGYARHNLKTNVAEMFAQPVGCSQSGAQKRISGIIIPKDAKNIKEKKKDPLKETSAKHKDRQILPLPAKRESETLSQ
ncbi:MAG: hypothetical protein ACD_16C00074G0010 [uncultured bacterium]|nr:MAG: hypothetical protein ACD_16C00074G0010 [uncultured bacterium]OFW68675.1 MAG: hypothetical protein A2X70_04325 [Alphaproteobacteria bacterium GWC2_42_16]OFW73312.1 MAG: hypothetical protein A2Z80_07415 [Alphaproteobacteria bacterium GWA2_41_27]OFW81777.1 MAG: hypothetical protein A3E50_02680 [Alphaproteobacteria bacterium RIFCSPHIGHO2_12_FULL_42_100]OFW85704.1 MAG: hypothetical protein A2W06_06550 [Alphaproteobacteria bacterium RBG_16_42_14]OFW90803.1 MAG: hypothetical protein A3C41_017